ncbi:Ig-like domain repeat protein [Rarobacter incanus]|uniref:Ig-like domain-containing protein n=1 Tax=Rarobacter incanus TaxID=153494 RepID=A0A542SRR2_9MICO|nr:Ig-like domain repeat protein [Rarobacter incanus]TQK77310.1 Ig-like domain-containing protein [Rarobacter incanus]
MNFPLSLKSTKISGIASWTQGAPAHAEVQLVRIYEDGDWDDVRTYDVGIDGAYSFYAGPGTYSLRLYSYDANWNYLYKPTWLGGSAKSYYSSDAQTFTIAANGVDVTKNITASQKYGALKVNLSAFGVNKNTAIFAFNLATGESNSANVTTNSAGSASAVINGLGSGTYYVRAATSGTTNSTVIGAESFGTPITAPNTGTVSLTGKALKTELSAGSLSSTISGQPRVGATLTAKASIQDVSTALKNATSYRYFWSDGTKLISTTSSAVVPAAALNDDVRLTVFASATGQLSTYGVSLASDDLPRFARGDSPYPLTVPSITGTAALGKTLTANTGSWAPSPKSFTYQWRRNGIAIPGATKASYAVSGADVGKTISLKITPVLEGFASKSIVTAPTGKVAKATAQISLAKKAKKGKARVTVTAKGIKAVTGVVTITVGKKTVKGKLTAKSKGKVTITLPKKVKGSKKVTVTYKGSAQVSKATKTAKAKITR